MFCPYCGKQNQEGVVFCTFCGKAMTQTPPTQASKSAVESKPRPKKVSDPKPRLSFAAVKAIATVILIIALVLVIVQFYYPSVFPWNS